VRRFFYLFLLGLALGCSSSEPTAPSPPVAAASSLQPTASPPPVPTASAPAPLEWATAHAMIYKRLASEGEVERSVRICVLERIGTCTWEKLSDGSKVTVRVGDDADDAESGYCSVEVENLPQWLVRELLQHKNGDPLYRVQLSNEQGSTVIEADFDGNPFTGRRAADGSLTIDQTVRIKKRTEAIRTAKLLRFY
jgi:hypothetical protein